MKTNHISIFNLIEIFRTPKRPVPNTINTETHCAQKHHHDFYCDAKSQYVNTNKNSSK